MNWKIFFFDRIKIDNEAKAVKLKGLYEYVNLLNVPKIPQAHVNFRLLIELCNVYKEERVEQIIKKLKEYGIITNSNEELEELITMAGNFADDFNISEKSEIKLQDNTKKALIELADLLSLKSEPEDLQNSIYKISKKNDVPPKEFFKILYQIILSTTKGPKIGPFIVDIGRDRVAQTLYKSVQP